MRFLPLAPLHPLPIVLSPCSALQQREEEEEVAEGWGSTSFTLHPPSPDQVHLSEMLTHPPRRFHRQDAEAVTDQRGCSQKPLSHSAFLPLPLSDRHRRSTGRCSESICRRVDHGLAERQPAREDGFTDWICLL